MKIFLLIAFVTLMFISGCAKKEMGCTPVSPQSEEPQIVAYASANGITAVKHNSGVYYQIIDTGTGATPNIKSTVTANYTGKLLSGTIFDQNTASFSLSGVIEGWQIGIPLIKKGGKIKLIIPSSYGYGCIDYKDQNGRVIIPGNSILYFDISLVDVK